MRAYSLPAVFRCIKIALNILALAGVFAGGRTFKLELVREIMMANDTWFDNYIFAVNDRTSDIAVYSYSAGSVGLVGDGGREGELAVRRTYEGASDGLGNPTDITFDPEGNIWLADPTLKTVTVYSPGLDLVRRDRFGSPGVEELSVSPDFHVLQFERSVPDGALLKVIDRSGRRETSFGRLPAEMTESMILIHHSVVSDEKFIYTGSTHSGVIAKYDRRGRLAYSIPTVEPVETAKVDRREIPILEGILSISLEKVRDTSRRAVIDMDVNDSLLLVLFSGGGGLAGRLLDIYEKETGIYRDTIDLAAVSDDYFLGLEVVGNRVYLQLEDRRGTGYIREYKLTVK